MFSQPKHDKWEGEEGVHAIPTSTMATTETVIPHSNVFNTHLS